MHILETYALSCGLKSEKPNIYEHYFPLVVDKYITFNHKFYPFFKSVNNLLKPILDKLNIKIIQIGASKDNIESDICISNEANFGQFSYILKNSLLHFGDDDYFFDIAANYDIPRVQIFTNTYPNTTKSYWGNEFKQRILFKLATNKPKYGTSIDFNDISQITPEEVAQSIFDLLGIKWSPEYKTLFIGPLYRETRDVIELIPNKEFSGFSNTPISHLSVRMDMVHDEQFLYNIINQTKISLVTNKPINFNLLSSFRHNLNEVVYFVDENPKEDFARQLMKLNVKYSLVTKEYTNKLKEQFFDIAPLATLIIPKQLEEIKSKYSNEQLFYKTSKRVIDGKKEYISLYDFINKRDSDSLFYSKCPEVFDYYYNTEGNFSAIFQKLTK